MYQGELEEISDLACIWIYLQTHRTDNQACLVFEQWCRKQTHFMVFFSIIVKACLLFINYIFVHSTVNGEIQRWMGDTEVCLYSVMCMLNMFSDKQMFWRIWKNSRIASSGLSPLPALTWTFITLYLYLTKWFYLFWDLHICQQHM